jgi:hypothetical protein
MTGVSAISESTPIFRYFAYANGSVSSTPLGTPLLTNAGNAVQVNIAFRTAPAKTVAGDTNAQTSIQNAALLRLTPPAYNSAAANLPCQ